MLNFPSFWIVDTYGGQQIFCLLTQNCCRAPFINGSDSIQIGQDVWPRVGRPISTICKGRSWFIIFHVLMQHDNSGKPQWGVRECSERRPVFGLLIFLWLERGGLIFDSYFESCSVLLHSCMRINKRFCGQLTCRMFCLNMSYSYNAFLGPASS